MLCSRVQNLLSAYCDRELAGVEMLQVRGHLRECASCQAEHDGLQQMKRLLGALGTPEPARPFHPNLLSARPRRHLLWPLQVRATWLLGDARRWWAAASALLASERPMALCATLAVLIVAAAILQRPQPADAVSANVPFAIAVDEARPFVASGPEPLYYGYLPATTPEVAPYGRPEPRGEDARLLPAAFVRSSPTWGNR
jgi:anti-sigma factor RsiW